MVFIFDEFDRSRDKSLSRLFADTMKAISDYTVNFTIILIGVADTVDDLIKEHASIDRQLIQIRMPRMSSGELADIIDQAMEKLEMTFNPTAKKKIIGLSQGLPHYTHLLGLASTRQALEMQKKNVDTDDVDRGIKQALENTSQSTITAYHRAVRSPRKENLFREVLLACALAQCDDLGYCAAADIRKPLSEIAGKEYKIPAYIRHLAAFSTEKRGCILTRSGDKRNVRFRFAHPLIQPFIVMKGIFDKLLSDNTSLLKEPPPTLF